QEGLLFHGLYDDRSHDSYIVQFVLDIDGELDLDALDAAARRLLERRPNLGARFVTTSLGRSVQVVCADTRIPVRRIDLADRTEAERSRAAEEAVREDRVRRFDLAAGPALRITDLRLGERSHRLLLTNHHILLDGWSMPL